jgi:hypothetical protein
MLNLFRLLCLRQQLPGKGSNNGYSSASVLKSSLNGGSLTIGLLKAKVEVTLGLTVYRQSVRLSVMPLETQDQIFFQLNSCGNSPYVTSPLSRSWVRLL